jgi:4-hydroxy-tetrahydrodipicolinate reductase
MKIAIIGYGKMGKIIERAAINRGHEICSIIDPVVPDAKFKSINEESISAADVCIEFTQPQSVFDNIKNVVNLHKDIVVGTTGWNDKREEVRRIVEEKDVGLVYAENFSLGVNIYFELINHAAKIMNKFCDYDVSGMEIHHKEKIDAPSGTAKTVANILVKSIDRKKTIAFQRGDRKINPDEIDFSSLRLGSVPGTHKVFFDSLSDTIELNHIARNREGFAFGAVIAAEWSIGKKGFISFNELILQMLENK